jgi:hypothetical protein
MQHHFRVSADERLARRRRGDIGSAGCSADGKMVDEMRSWLSSFEVRSLESSGWGWLSRLSIGGRESGWCVCEQQVPSGRARRLAKRMVAWCAGGLLTCLLAVCAPAAAALLGAEKTRRPLAPVIAANTRNEGERTRSGTSRRGESPHLGLLPRGLLLPCSCTLVALLLCARSLAQRTKRNCFAKRGPTRDWRRGNEESARTRWSEEELLSRIHPRPAALGACAPLSGWIPRWT